jgi:hypothetical protein
MKPKIRNQAILISEILMFVIILAVIWIDEFLDIPHHWFGAPPSPSRLEEYIIETGTVVLVGLLILAGTILFLKRIDRIERYLRVCAWCRKVWSGERWVVFEEYVLKEHSLVSSHSICPECAQNMKWNKGKRQKHYFKNK